LISTNSTASLAGSTKRYRMVHIPSDIDIFGEICFTTIGQGPCVCFTRNCGVSHQGSVVRFRRGELCVSKTPTTVFSEPIIAADLLSEEVLSEWFTLSLTIEDWTTRFRSAASVGARQAEVTPELMLGMMSTQGPWEPEHLQPEPLEDVSSQ
jgi:hypothetical protein